MERIYIAIDLKSFYASVECVERGLSPLDTNLVVADASRTEKTICLAVSPALKSVGIPGRPRLFEVVAKTAEENRRRAKAIGKAFSGESCSAEELKKNPQLKLSYIAAPPRMQLYTKYSTDIYAVYLKYVAPEDMHVYSIDEVFIDVTNYLKTYKMTAHELAMTMILDVLNTTGITATAGIGTNLYLCKIAMDIMAKRMPPDENGVRIAYLDEEAYRRELWSHRPLTDFWRVGRATAKKLESNRLYTMGDIARYSLSQYGENLLYKLFGVNAELLIDHAWGWEPCTIADIKSYRPQNNSLSSGQVLKEPYSFEKTRLIVKEMAELLALDLLDKALVTNQTVLTIGYDVENINDPLRKKSYKGEITADAYGRKVPKPAHGSDNIGRFTASSRLITESVLRIFDRVADEKLLVRRLTLAANHVISERDIPKNDAPAQLDMFTDYEKEEQERGQLENALEREKSMQRAMLGIKKKFGKNAIIKGMNLEEGATTVERNNQIGGHRK